MATVLGNIRPWGREPVDVTISGETITAVHPHDAHAPAGASTAGATKRIAGHGLLALPTIINTHAHVDKSWLGSPWQSYGGEPTTQGRIVWERQHRDRLGIPSVAITTAVLREFIRHGTTAIRTHVDVDVGLGLRGLDVVRESIAALDGAMVAQLVAFPQDGVLRRDGVARLLRRAAAEGVEFVGGLDPASIDRDPVGQLDILFDIAADSGCGVDIHLHDPAELGAFQFDLIIARATKYDMVGKINIAHGFALAQVEPQRRADLLAAMAELDISLTTVAPLRLPQLPLAELDAAGVAFGFGTDGIRDLWSPFGTGDTLGIAWQYARASSLVTDEDLLRVVELATRDAARFVGRGVHDITPGARADILLVDAENPMDALVRLPARRLVMAGGQVVHEQ